MPIYRNKEKGRFIFEFDRYINGQRIRATKHLPKTWNQSQADAFDRQESAKLYAQARGLEAPDFTIEDAVQKYLEHRVPQLKHGKNVTQELALLFPYYQARPLSALLDVCKTFRLKAKREVGKEPLAPATIKNRIRYLTAACRYAWKHHSMGSHDPASGVVVPEVNNERHVYLTRKEMIQLCRACKRQKTRALIRVAFYTGMRFGEILRAKIKDGCFVLHDTKNNNPRIIPIHDKIKRIAATKWPSRYTLMYHYRAAREKMEFDYVHFHDMRHSAASAMIQAGVSLNTVGDVLGHKSPVSTKRYSHLSTENLRAAIQLISKKAA